jgi:hypothetical protein
MVPGGKFFNFMPAAAVLIGVTVVSDYRFVSYGLVHVIFATLTNATIASTDLNIINIEGRN